VYGRAYNIQNSRLKIKDEVAGMYNQTKYKSTHQNVYLVCISKRTWHTIEQNECIKLSLARWIGDGFMGEILLN
jgi:hypothetical protein